MFNTNIVGAGVKLSCAGWSEAGFRGEHCVREMFQDVGLQMTSTVWKANLA